MHFNTSCLNPWLIWVKPWIIPPYVNVLIVCEHFRVFLCPSSLSPQLQAFPQTFAFYFICFHRFESSIPGNPGGTEQCWTSTKPCSIRWRRFQVSLASCGNRNWLGWDPAETILTIVKIGTQRKLFWLLLRLGPNGSRNNLLLMLGPSGKGNYQLFRLGPNGNGNYLLFWLGSNGNWNYPICCSGWVLAETETIPSVVQVGSQWKRKISHLLFRLGPSGNGNYPIYCSGWVLAETETNPTWCYRILRRTINLTERITDILPSTVSG